MERDRAAGMGRVTEEDYIRCIRCGLCAYSCPTYRATRLQAQSPRGRVALLRAAGYDAACFGDSLASSIYSCTLCAACTRACPAGVRVDELLLGARQDLAAQSQLPAGLARLSRVLDVAHNLSGEDNRLRLLWAENMARLPSGAGRGRAEVVYFVGCVGSFYPRSYAVPQAAVQILEAAGVDYALLGGEEWCCGFPLWLNGARRAAEEAMAHNVEQVLATGASRVVFTCPSCYAMWQHQYRAVAGRALENLQIEHFSELLAGLLAQDRLPLHRLDTVVTYHDPCDLGRKGKIVEAPRQVLRGIPGLSLVEMRDTRENALCCGGGGNLETFNAELAQAAASRRLAQALDTGASTIVSACQQCERTLAAAARRDRAPVRVVDLAEIVRQALG